MWNEFLDEGRKAIFFAQDEAVKKDCVLIDADFLFLGCLRVDSEETKLLISSTGVDITAVKAGIAKRVRAWHERGRQEEPMLSSDGRRVIDRAIETARELGDKFIGVDHLMIGVAKVSDSLLATELKRRGIKASDLTRRLQMAREILAARAAEEGADKLAQLFHAFEPLDLLAFTLLQEIAREVSVEEANFLALLDDKMEKVALNVKGQSSRSEISETLADAVTLAATRRETLHAAHLLTALYRRQGTSVARTAPEIYPTPEAMLDRLVPKPK